MAFYIDKNGPFACLCFTIYFALVLSIGKVCIIWSMVFYHHSNTLLPCVPALPQFVTLPSELPMHQAKFHWCIPGLVTL